MFLRQHNRLAEAIKRTKRSWNGQRIYDLARTINTAIYRKIIYNDWTDVVLGRSVAARLRTIASTPTDSNATIVAAVSNEFATAAIRFYYSMMPGDLKLSSTSSSNDEECAQSTTNDNWFGLNR